MRIVFFDSGVGGLTVLHEAAQQLPSESFLYYADTRHVPYGVHTREDVYRFVRESIEDLLAEQPIRAIVIACNTATSAAVRQLREQFAFPIIGMEPAVKPALQSVQQTGKHVLVTATPLTLKEEKFQKLVAELDQRHQVSALGLPGLVQLAEAGSFDDEQAMHYLREQLKPFDMTQYGAIVLGCTHFLFYREAIRALVPPDVTIWDGNAGTVNRLRHVLELPDADCNAPQQPLDVLFRSSLHTPEEERRLERALHAYTALQHKKEEQK